VHFKTKVTQNPNDGVSVARAFMRPFSAARFSTGPVTSKIIFPASINSYRDVFRHLSTVSPQLSLRTWYRHQAWCNGASCTSCGLSAAIPPSSKLFPAPLEDTGSRNIPRHLVTISPNIGSLRLRLSTERHTGLQGNARPNPPSGL